MAETLAQQWAAPDFGKRWHAFQSPVSPDVEAVEKVPKQMFG